MTILQKVKNSLRIDGYDHDEELQDLIETAQLLIREAGVTEHKSNDASDAIIRNMYITFTKSHFGADDSKQRFTQAFESMLTKVSLSSTYNEQAPIKAEQEVLPVVPEIKPETEVGVDNG